MVSFANYGVDGRVAVGRDKNYLAFLAAFILIWEMSVVWQALSIVLAVMLVASSADTVQTGVAALLKPITAKALNMYKPDAADNLRLLMACNLFMTVALVNVPAIVLSTAGVSVRSLFVFADLICATCFVPILMGLSDRTHPVAAAAGCLTGFLSAFLIYLIGVNGENGGGTPMKMLLAAGGLYSDTSLVAFLIVPTSSFVATVLVKIPYHLHGYRFAGFGKASIEAKPPNAV
jgi:hypothetical protein